MKARILSLNFLLQTKTEKFVEDSVQENFSFYVFILLFRDVVDFTKYQNLLIYHINLVLTI